MSPSGLLVHIALVGTIGNSPGIVVSVGSIISVLVHRRRWLLLLKYVVAAVVLRPRRSFIWW